MRISRHLGIYNAKVIPAYWYLYYYGNEYAAVTGGWATYAGPYAGSDVSATKNSDNITLVASAGGSTSRTAYAQTASLVDLTDAKRLVLMTTQTTGGTSYLFSAFEVLNSSGAVVLSANIATGNSIETTLDVSGLSGSYRIRVRDYSTAANISTVKRTVIMYRVTAFST